MSEQAPTATRILKDGTDWEALTHDELLALREKANRTRSSRLARIITGWPHRGVRIEQQMIDLPGRQLALRVHRPKGATAPLPLVLSFHGGAFLLGTAAQNDWLNSHLAAALPAVVVSVEYRLAPEAPLPQPLEDGYDTLIRLVADHEHWRIDPRMVALLGESAGGTIAALISQRAREEGPTVRAQVLTCPVTDWTATMTEYPSVIAHAGEPGLSLSLLRAARDLALPSDVDPDSVSPLMQAGLDALPPTLVVTAALDPVADHGSRYVANIVAAGGDARLSHHSRAVHAFLSLPGLVPAARRARGEVRTFLTHHLRAPVPDATAAGPR